MGGEGSGEGGSEGTKPEQLTISVLFLMLTVVAMVEKKVGGRGMLAVVINVVPGFIMKVHVAVQLFSSVALLLWKR